MYNDIISKLSSERNILIKDSISEEEINDLKNLEDNVTLEIFIKDLNKLTIVLDKLLEYKKLNKILLHVNDRNKFNTTTIFSNPKYEKLIDTILYEEKDDTDNEIKSVDFIQYKKAEKILDDMAKPIINGNYSPLEKYLFAYNIIKNFKVYNDPKKLAPPEVSRNVYEILFNKFIVCSGYTNLLDRLLEKIGFESTIEHLEVENGENHEIIGHSRIHIHLVDPKYKIDGYFTSDPTFDNTGMYDLYIHALMTNIEALINRRTVTSMKKEPSSDAIIFELFGSVDVKEFHQKVDYIVKRNSTLKSNIKNIYFDIMKGSLTILNRIDSKKYSELSQKYNVNDFDNIEKIFSKYIDELSSYVISMSNKTIEASTIIDAIMVVIEKEIFNGDKKAAAQYKEEIILNNNYIYDYLGLVYIIANDITDEVVYESKNKFDIR